MMTFKRFAFIGTGLVVLLGGIVERTAPAAPPALPAPAALAASQAPAEPIQLATSAIREWEIAPEVDQLRSDLARVIAGPAWRNAQFGVLVVSLERGDTLFSLNPDLPLAPASNMKLYSTAAALYYLGPEFRYSTYVLADGEIRDGILHGDLVLYGTGDPAISSRMLPGALTPLRALTDSLRAHGIREIRGDVLGDGSYFDDRWIGDGWREEYRLDSYSAPIGALSLAENIVSIRVGPGAPGQPAEIRTMPSTAGLLVQNQVRTVASGNSSVRFSYDPDGLLIEGQIARGHPGVARTVTVVDPANFAASAFRNLLEQDGIAVAGTVRTVRDPAESPINRGAREALLAGAPTLPPRVLGTHLSPTLAEIATVTNHVSQNLFAEALFKTAGRIAIGDGSFDAGARAVQYFLECEQPIDFTGVTIVDGSGLSPLNRVTARTTIHLLDLMTRTDLWEVFHASLPEAASPNGGTHSLRGRMGGTPAARNLRAKTGTINNVSSLSGYVTAANGEQLAFAIFANEVPSTWQAKRIEDAIGIRLARFTRAAPIAGAESLIGTPAGEAPEVDSTGVDQDPAGGGGAADRDEDLAAPAPIAQPAPQAPPSGNTPAPTRQHRVVRGDTFDGIARRYGTSVTELRRLNPGIEPRRIQPGQSITIPG